METILIGISLLCNKLRNSVKVEIQKHNTWQIMITSQAWHPFTLMIHHIIDISIPCFIRCLISVCYTGGVKHRSKLFTVFWNTSYRISVTAGLCTLVNIIVVISFCYPLPRTVFFNINTELWRISRPMHFNTVVYCTNAVNFGTILMIANGRTLWIVAACKTLGILADTANRVINIINA